MAPRSKVANLSFTVDSASEDEMTVDELNALPTPAAIGDTKAPGRKARGSAAQTRKRAPATKAPAKDTPATRRRSASSAVVAKKAPAKGGRKAIGRAAQADASETEDVDSFDEQETALRPKPARRGRPPKKALEEKQEEPAPAPAKRGRKAAGKESAEKTQAKAKSRGTKRALDDEPEPEPESEQMTIPETQAEPDADAMDVSESIGMEEIPESMPHPVRPSARRAQAQPNSRARRTSAAARRTGSVSDSERDPVMRRKVGDLTRKLDAMTAKYEALKEAASSGKESNFDQLKKRTDQTTRDQDAVITALKQQISDLQARTSALTSLQKDVAAASKESARLAAENKKLADSLSTSQRENKTLSSKLAAARSSSDPTTTTTTTLKTVPGSAVKAKSTGVVLPGTTEAAKEATLAKQKVDLYSDLTNLIVLGVKKAPMAAAADEDEDIYDCLQTGRNGTLHFHLTVASSPGSPYQDSEFIYRPLLDAQRDHDLVDLLPDYLTEEICFPRAQAAKFYTKVVECMGRKVVLDDEDDGDADEEGQGGRDE